MPQRLREKPMDHFPPEPAEGSSWPVRCPPWQAVPAPPPSAPPAASRRGRGEPPDCSKIKAAGPPSPKAAAHLPMVCRSRPKAYAVLEAVHPWTSSQMACHRSRSRGAGARISRRCKSLASICHCSRNRSISLTPITNPSLTPRRASPTPHQIYRITLCISPRLWFSFAGSPCRCPRC